MKKFLEIGLGIMVAMGGFIDIGDLVFSTQAGANFGYQLLWALAVGVLGIIVYAEMCGRVTMVTKKPVFEVIRDHYNARWGWTTLVGSLMLNVLTCAAEIGGIALALQLLSDLPYNLLITIAALSLILIVWVLPFKGIERLFGYVGLGLLAIAVAAIKLQPDWGSAAHGLLPTLGSGNHLDYFYFAIGIIAATLMPYEIYFYSSGAVEEKWKPKADMIVNRANSIIGFLLGGVAVAGIIIASAELLKPASIDPQFVGTPLLPALVTLGKAGLALAILGAVFTISGAAIETCFSGAYNLSQFLGWKWGKHEDQFKVPRFTITWIAIFVLAALIIFTGADPITVTEYAVIFSVVVMPLSYWPMLRMAQNKPMMGKYTNKLFANTMGWLFFVVICIVSLAAVPLMIITNRGQL
ncbi:Nramp family divalent metal transporter [Candidatus Saccharibacteria bacterium]|nr:Nramp family divalent metal transporter [Candidatus Saccharibacteria bacterium]